MHQVDVSVLRELLEYDPQTGALYWKPRIPSMFQIPKGGGHTQQTMANKWNRRYAGKQAFTSLTNFGYPQGRVFRNTYLAHRVAWTIATGAWPVKEIDHINGNRADNRLVNLREADRHTNAINKKIDSRNTTGVMGVYWVDRIDRWHARISHETTKINLGYFKTYEEAVAARKGAEKVFGYHPNHGRL